MLREPTFLIMSAVAAEPLHGYGIIKAVEQMSSGRVRLRAGTLYAALDRLVDHGTLEVSGEEKVDGRRRVYYRITDGGLGELRSAIEHMEANAASARQRMARGAQVRLA